jgi:hypothetical protein
MPYYDSTGPPVSSLSERLGRLRDTFDNLASQLHGGIARAIADAIAAAIEQGLRKVLGGGTGRPTVHPTWSDRPGPWPQHPTRSDRWPEDESVSWLEDDDSDEDVDWQQTVAMSERPATVSATTEQRQPSRWLPALVSGIRGAFWWLRRYAPGRPIRTSLAIGLSAALAILVVPATWAVGLGAIAVADAARAGVAELASRLTS